MLREKADDRLVAAHAVAELEHVVTLVLEDEVVDLVPEALELVHEVARLSLDDPRIVLALDDEERARDLPDVGPRRPLDEKIAVDLGVSYREREVRLPRLGDAIHEREQVVRPEHVDSGPPELWVPRGEREGHVAAVRAADHAST